MLIEIFTFKYFRSIVKLFSPFQMLSRTCYSLFPITLYFNPHQLYCIAEFSTISECDYSRCDRYQSFWLNNCRKSNLLSLFESLRVVRSTKSYTDSSVQFIHNWKLFYRKRKCFSESESEIGFSKDNLSAPVLRYNVLNEIVSF